MISLLGRTKRPDLIFRSDGHFDITKRIVSLLGIQPGDAIDVMRDGDNYLFYVAKKSAQCNCRHEARCYPTNKLTYGHLRGCSSRLCKAMRHVAGTSGKAAFSCGEIVTLPDGSSAASIITRLNLATL